MARMHLIVASCLLLLMGTSLATGLQSHVNENSPLFKLSREMGSIIATEWDLSKVGTALLQNIVNNGLPSMNIPPLDPLELNGNLSLEMPALPGVIAMDYSEFSNIKVTDLKTAYFGKLSILPSLKVLIDLELPKLNVDGEWYNFTGIVGDLIPFYGFGDFQLALGAGVLVEVTMTQTSQDILQMSGLEIDLILHNLTVHFSNLMGGQGDIFNELIGEKANEILDLIKPAFFPDLSKSVQKLINDFLLQNEMTIQKLVQCALFPDKCLSKKKDFPSLFSLPLKFPSPRL